MGKVKKSQIIIVQTNVEGSEQPMATSSAGWYTVPSSAAPCSCTQRATLYESPSAEMRFPADTQHTEVLIQVYLYIKAAQW